MASTFNSQILVDKLNKLNISQASIETLSHWCIFHMNKAKQVVGTWEKQFHCSPREKRLAFLYLSNDILQNSRRKGTEFAVEFWKVLPGALRDVVENGDEYERNAALRLIGIWEERKVFGTRGQSLKEELLGNHAVDTNKNGKPLGIKQHPAGITLDKIISCFQVVPRDEDAVMSKCRNATSYFEKLDKEIGGNINSGKHHEAAFVDELQGQHAVLRDSIEQLTAIESSRAILVSRLRDALLEQESKLEQVRHQLQAARSRSEHAGNIYNHLLHSTNVQLVAEKSSKEPDSCIPPQSFTQADGDQSAPVMYARQSSFPERSSPIEEDPRKSAAAAMAAKLTASTSSAEMLSYVLSSLASEGVIGNPIKESSSEYPSDKRAKLEADQPYIPTQMPLQNPLSFHQNIPTTTHQLTSNDLPAPPSSPPPPPPPPPVLPYSMAPFAQNTGPINGMPQSYGLSQQLQPPLPGYPTSSMQVTGLAPYSGATTASYQNYQGPEANLYSQQSSASMAPISRQ